MVYEAAFHGFSIRNHTAVNTLARTLVDSGATRIFISERFITRHELRRLGSPEHAFSTLQLTPDGMARRTRLSKNALSKNDRAAAQLRDTNTQKLKLMGISSIARRNPLNKSEENPWPGMVRLPHSS